MEKILVLLTFDIWFIRREAILVITNMITTIESKDELLIISSNNGYKLIRMLVQALKASV